MAITLNDITPEKAECVEIMNRIGMMAALYGGNAIYRMKDEHVRWLRASLSNAFHSMENGKVLIDGGAQADRDVAELEGRTFIKIVDMA